MRILLIEDDDDPAIATTARRRLWRQGHVVDVATDGETGLERAASGGYDAIILDVLLPDSDGVTLTQRLRAAGIATPIIMVAARASVDGLSRGLEAGADDYLAKPIVFQELAARLSAITRRGEKPLQEGRLVVGDLMLDQHKRLVTRGGRPRKLAPKEFALLEYLMRHPGHVFTRAALLEHVWDYGFDPTTNVVDAAIKRLRRAVDAGETRPMIHTVRGVGYKIQD